MNLKNIELVDELIIDSKDKESTSTSDTDFTVKITTPPKKVTHFQLKKVIIPNNWDNVTTKNQDFTLEGVGKTIPAGYYDIDGLINELDTQTTGVATWSFDNEHRITITSAGPNITFIPGDAYKLLGFDDVTYSGATSYTAPNYPDLIQDRKYFTLHSDTLSKRALNHSHHTDHRSNVLTIIPITEEHGRLQVWEPQDEKIYKIVNDHINLLDFKLNDSANTVVDLHGNHIILIIARYQLK
jgi:signal peptidase I